MITVWDDDATSVVEEILLVARRSYVRWVIANGASAALETDISSASSSIAKVLVALR